MGFSRQEYWSGLPFPSSGDLPSSGIASRSLALLAESLLSEPPGKPMWKWCVPICVCLWSAVKRNEVGMHVTTWMSLENSKLCEQSQTEMGTHCVFHLYEMSRKSNTETESRRVVAYNWGEGFPGGSVVKNPPANAGDVGSVPGSWRSSEERNGSPLQHSCLRNPTDRGAWWATVHGVAKSWAWLSD